MVPLFSFDNTARRRATGKGERARATQTRAVLVALIFCAFVRVFSSRQNDAILVYLKDKKRKESVGCGYWYVYGYYINLSIDSIRTVQLVAFY